MRSSDFTFVKRSKEQEGILCGLYLYGLRLRGSIVTTRTPSVSLVHRHTEY